MNTSKDDTFPKNFKCECGSTHEFPAYVFAHWRDAITHTCSHCERRHTIMMGRATLIRATARTKAA
jgi:hypothetical protein